MNITLFKCKHCGGSATNTFYITDNRKAIAQTHCENGCNYENENRNNEKELNDLLK